MVTSCSGADLEQVLSSQHFTGEVYFGGGRVGRDEVDDLLEDIILGEEACMYSQGVVARDDPLGHDSCRACVLHSASQSSRIDGLASQ